MARVTKKIGGAGNWLWSGMMWMAENNPRLREAQRLSRMSDSELAAVGLKREEIGRKVFGDMFYC